jgi:hypothetical protein
MTVDIPELANASFPEQARLYGVDLAILGQPPSLTGVKSGCAVTAQGSPNMTLAVAAGVIYWLNAEVTVTAANATNPRIDLVVVSSTGVKSVIAGTPAAIPVPAPPSTVATSIVLAQVFVPANDTAIGATQIRDRRIIVQVPSVLGATTMVRKTADESVTSSTTLQNDNHLLFAVTSNGRWAVKFVLMMTQPTTNNSMAVNFTAPSGTVWRLDAGTQKSVSDGPNTALSFSISQSPIIFIVEGVVTTVGTSGTFQLQWAQGSASANAMSMLTNSYLEYRPLP